MKFKGLAFPSQFFCFTYDWFTLDCSSVMAVVTCLIGLHYGHIIVHFKVTQQIFSIFLFLSPSMKFFFH